LTAPDPVAEADAEAVDDADVLGEVAADVVDELELQPAAASPMKARPTTANRAGVDRKVSMVSTLATATCAPQ
jgi:hypothetical protein